MFVFFRNSFPCRESPSVNVDKILELLSHEFVVEIKEKQLDRENCRSQIPAIIGAFSTV